MAEALASLGVAASIAQFVTLGIKGASLAWKAYQSADGLLEEQEDLLKISEDIQERCRLLQTEPIGEIDKGLAKLLQAARELGIDLENELLKLKRASNAGPLNKIWQVLRTLRRKSKIEDIEKRLVKLRDEIILSLVIATRRSQSKLSETATIKSAEFNDSHQIELIHQTLRNLKESVHTREEFDKRLEDVASEIERFATRALLRQRQEKILKSLHFKKISQRFGTIPKAHENTFHWSLYGDRTSLPEWLRSSSGIYWIEGKAGSGKSTLMKYLTREGKTKELLLEWADSHPLVIIKHFFWGPGNDLQRGLEGLFRTMLFQVLMEYPELIPQVCPERMEESGFRHLESWTVDDLKTCFQALTSLKSLPARFCFFIDGLDEFRGSPDELTAIIKFIAKSQEMKLCVSSRPWIEFQEAFGHLTWQLHVHELTHDDIARFVHDELGQSERYRALKREAPESAQLFQTEIVSRAKGVFLWVYLVTRSLITGLQRRDDMSTLQRRLAAFPTELEEYFMAMLNSIDPIYQEESSEILSVMAYSQSNMSVSLLRACLDMQDHADRFYSQLDLLSIPTRRTEISSTSGEIRTAFHMLHDSVTGLVEGTPAVDKVAQSHIVQRCKDLVFAYEDADDSSGSASTSQSSAKIGFLHRTVADFLALPRVETILQSRVRKNFDARSALAHAYMASMVSEVRVINTMIQDMAEHVSQGRVQLDKVDARMAENFFLGALYEASQLKNISQQSYERVMLLIITIFLIRESAFVSRASSPLEEIEQAFQSQGYDDLNDLTVVIGSDLCQCIFGCGRQLLNLFPRSVQVIGRFYATKFDLKEPSLVETLIHRLGLQMFNPTFRQVLMNLGGPQLQQFPLQHYLAKELKIVGSSIDDLVLQESDMINLIRLEEAVLVSAFGASVTSSFAQRNRDWILCLQQIVRFRKENCPSNLYDAVQFLVLQGVPRYLWFTRKEASKDTPRWPYPDPVTFRPSREERIWNEAIVEPEDFEYSSDDRIKVDSVKILQQLSFITDKRPDGLRDMFALQNDPRQQPARTISMIRYGQDFISSLFWK